MAGLAARFGRVLGLREGQVAVGVEAAAVPVAVAADNAALPMMRMGGGGVIGRDGASASSVAGVEFAGMRALVADDSAINCTILRTFLERLGFDVTLAADGQEALERWMPGGHDLVCMDIEMPRMDGLTAFVRMRDEAAAHGVAMPMALAVTINAMTREVTGYLEAGFDACLPKPFSRNDLVGLLRRRWPADAV